MLTYVEDIPEVVSSFIVPVSQQVTHKLINALQCDNVFQNKIMHTGDFVANSKTSTDLHEAILDDNRCICNIDVDMNPYSQLHEKTNDQDFMDHIYDPRHIESKRPIFADLETETYIICQETAVSLKLGYKLSFKDRVIAYRAYDRVLTLNGTGGVFLSSNYIYTYPIPQTVYEILYTVHKLRGGTLEDFMRYLRTMSEGLMSSNHNRSRPMESMDLVVRGNTSGVYTNVILNDDKPQAVKDNHSAKTYDIELGIEVQLQRPQFLYTKYPIVVHNQPIPESLVFKQHRDSYQPVHAENKYFPQENVRDILDPDTAVNELVRFPWYDEWMIPPVIGEMGYTPVLSAVITLDDVDNPLGETLVNMDHPIAGRQLTDDVINGLQELQNLALYPGERFWLMLFAHNRMQNQSSLDFSDGIQLKIPNRDVKKIYHLVLAVKEGIVHGNLNVFRVGRFDIVTCKE